MKDKVPIFEYHDIVNKMRNSVSFHSPYILLKENFHKQISWLYHNGYQTLTIDDLLSGNASNKSFILTFDDGHISNYKFAFPILKEFSFIATFFIVPNFVGRENYISTDNIIEMYRNGMKFESHSLTHPYIVSLDRRKILHEIIESKQCIQDMLKVEVKHFSVPYGFYNKYLIHYLKEAGYRSLVTEDFGYYVFKDSSFHILPRFTVKSNSGLTTLQNIVEGRKIFLLPNYAKASGIRYYKLILGYKNYIRFKSLLIKRLHNHLYR